MLKLPVRPLTSALLPTATLLLPLRFRIIAAVPAAVFWPAPTPLVRASVPAPRPVLKLALPAKKLEYQPIAVSPRPPVTRKSALHPSAVLNAG